MVGAESVVGVNGGHGIAGLRAALYGGEVQAGAGPGGGFRLLVKLPFETAAHE